MNKITIVFILSSLFLFSCSSLPHNPEAAPITTVAGTTQVQIKLHEDDKAIPGELVNAFIPKCKEVVTTKGFVRTICSGKLVGQGKLLSVSADGIGLVEFDKSVRVENNSTFEVVK